MLSKIKIKLIKSLKYKKFREEHGLFIVEGKKIVSELISLIRQNKQIPYNIDSIFATKEWLNDYSLLLSEKSQCITITNEELLKISFLKTPNQVLALVSMKEPVLVKSVIEKSLSLILDQIQDPGNLGTIIRIADWYGIKHLICSADCVDVYNPKTVQASMGSLFRVNVYYSDLEKLLAEYSDSKNFMIYGTFMEGENIYTTRLTDRGFIILGNESKGISPVLHPQIKRKITIPTYEGTVHPDSLNVAAAAAIVCSEFRRRK